MLALPISGLCPLTTIDYPGHLAAVLFTQGCPYRCLYCHNASLQKPGKGTLDPNQIEAFLHQRRGKLEAVVISGGEPTIHPKLPETLATLQGLGFKTGLHTAGPNPNTLAACLPYLNWVGLDVKESSPEGYSRLTGSSQGFNRTLQSLLLLKKSQIPFQVRTTFFPSHVDESTAQEIDKLLNHFGVPPTIRQPYKEPKKTCQRERKKILSSLNPSNPK